jgi:two-component system response regulator (stage 0 sporulation protein F)
VQRKISPCVCAHLTPRRSAISLVLEVVLILLPVVCDQMARHYILVVDDDAGMRDVLREHVTRMGYSVETAANGAEALAAILCQRPDLVLLDLRMPGMNGLDVLKQIQDIDKTIPVMMVSGENDHSVIGETLKRAVFAFVPKPFDSRYLHHLVTAIVG